MPIQENLTNPLKVSLHNTYTKLAIYFKLYHNDPTISSSQTYEAQLNAIKALLDCQKLHNDILPNNILKTCSVFITTKIDDQFAPEITLEGFKKEIYYYTWTVLKEFNKIAKNEENQGDILLHTNPMLIDTLGAVDVCLAVLNGQLPESSKDNSSSLSVLEMEKEFLSRWYNYDETIDTLQVMLEHIHKGVALQNIIAHDETDQQHTVIQNEQQSNIDIVGNTQDTCSENNTN